MRKLLVSLTLALFALPALAGTWDIDPGHSTAGFKVRHLAIANVTGTFGKVTGKVVWDPASPASSSVEAVIDATTIDTGNAERDKDLRSANFFDVEKFPTITFKSKSVKPASGGLAVTGDLTIHGVTKEVVLQVEGPVPPIKDPWGNTKSGAAATTKIDRQDFGISWSRTMDTGGLVVGNEVSISIDVEMMLKP